MQAYLDLLAAGKLNIEPLITHEFPLERAKEAYDMILAKKEHYCAVLLVITSYSIHYTKLYEKFQKISEYSIDMPRKKKSRGVVFVVGELFTLLEYDFKYHC